MPEQDETCAAKGIPDHLHTGGRLADDGFDAVESAYIRFPMEERKLTSVLNFRHRSFNRSKYSSAGPDDVLWNSEAGGRYEGWGVAALSIGPKSMRKRLREALRERIQGVLPPELAGQVLEP